MHKLWAFFVHKRSFTFLLTISLFLAGIVSLVTIPKESNPEVDAPFIFVSTVLPGASATDVEQLVTKKLEDQLNSGLEDIKEITSTSSQGFSSIFIEFNADADVESLLLDARNEIENIKGELPDDVTDPRAAKFDFSDQPVVTFSISSDTPLTELITLSEDVERELKRIQGVSRVGISGVRGREVQVIVRRESLDAYDLSLQQIIGAIAQANAALPIGNITISGIEYAINFEGEIDNPTAVGAIPIFERSGVPIYLRDIAFISDGVSGTSSFSRVSLEGSAPEQAITFSVFKRSGADVTKVTKNVRDRLEELQNEGEILEGESIVYSFDIGKDVQSDLTTLSLTALQTIILVILILLVALGWREALIAGLAIPLSFVIAFIGLNVSGNTLNFVSLFSLILSVGILVDSAIVITEGMYTKIKMGMNKTQAALGALEELAWPVIAGTMTTVAVFAPLFFLSGITGEFIKSIPFTVIFVLLASLFVALGIVPLLAATFLRKPNGKTRAEKRQEHYTELLTKKYVIYLRRLISSKKNRHKFYWVITITLFLVILLPLMGIIRSVFFEDDDQPYVFVDIEMEQGTTLIETDLVAREVERIVAEEKDVESFITSVGSLSEFGAGSGSRGGQNANLTVILHDKRDSTSVEISDILSEKLKIELPNVTTRTSVLSGGPPTGAPFEMQILGEDFDSLEEGVQLVIGILENIDGTKDIETSRADDGIEFSIKPDREKITEVGLNVSTIAGTLRSAVYGVTATTLRTGEDDIDVNVRLDLNPEFVDINRSVQTTLDEIRNISIPTQRGTVLLGSLVEVELKKTNAVINRKDLKRSVTITSQLEADYNAIEVQAEFQQRLEEAGLPDGVETSFGGETEETNQSFAEMGFALVAGIILIFSILVLQFNSFRQALIIISIALFIIIGVFLGLLISGQPISFPSMMGFIAVVGIAVNNSIILIDVMNRLRAENGMSPLEIVIAGASQRLRPILLTTLTTVIGIIPLTYASALWSPLAYAILFGLLFTTGITLFLVPALEYGGLLDFGFRFFLTLAGFIILGGIAQIFTGGFAAAMPMIITGAILFAVFWLWYRWRLRKRTKRLGVK